MDLFKQICIPKATKLAASIGNVYSNMLNVEIAVLELILDRCEN